MTRVWPLWARAAIVVPLTLLLLWLTIGVTASLTLANSNPVTALRFWPASAEAREQRAQELLKVAPDKLAENSAELLQLGRAALSRQPVSAIGARTMALALVVADDKATAETWFHRSEALSRRDLPTQLYFIEAAVERGDIPEALQHYDRASRVSVAIRSVLFPILADASSEPDVARPLGDILISRPEWWSDFYRYYLVNRSSPEMLTEITGRLKLDASDPNEEAMLAAALDRLAISGDYALAWRLYRAARGGAATTVRDGGFELAGRLTPFEWAISDKPELLAIREGQVGVADRAGLSIYGPQAGAVAQQVLRLDAGEYRISAIIGNISLDSAARPSIVVQCQSGDQRELLRTRLPTTGTETGAFLTPLRVPTGQECRFQRLIVMSGTRVDTGGAAPWVDEIAITPRSGAN